MSPMSTDLENDWLETPTAGNKPSANYFGEKWSPPPCLDSNANFVDFDHWPATCEPASLLSSIHDGGSEQSSAEASSLSSSRVATPANSWTSELFQVGSKPEDDASKDMWPSFAEPSSSSYSTTTVVAPLQPKNTYIQMDLSNTYQQSLLMSNGEHELPDNFLDFPEENNLIEKTAETQKSVYLGKCEQNKSESSDENKKWQFPLDYEFREPSPVSANCLGTHQRTIVRSKAISNVQLKKENEVSKQSYFPSFQSDQLIGSTPEDDSGVTSDEKKRHSEGFPKIDKVPVSNSANVKLYSNDVIDPYTNSYARVSVTPMDLTCSGPLTPSSYIPSTSLSTCLASGSSYTSSSSYASTPQYAQAPFRFLPGEFAAAMNAPIAANMGLDTMVLAKRISKELKENSIPQSAFAEKILGRSQGTLSDLLKTPKPWSVLKNGKETYTRMYNWLQLDKPIRMALVNLSKEEVASVTGKPAQTAAKATKRANQNDQQSGVINPQAAPPLKKARLVFTDVQRKTLLTIFKENPHPDKSMLEFIANHLGLEVSTIVNFYMNVRRRNRLQAALADQAKTGSENVMDK